MTIKWHFVQDNCRIYIVSFDSRSKGNQNLPGKLAPCRSIWKLLHLIFFLGFWKADWGIFPEFSFSVDSIGIALCNYFNSATSGWLSSSTTLREFYGFSLGLACILILTSSWRIARSERSLNFLVFWEPIRPVNIHWFLLSRNVFFSMLSTLRSLETDDLHICICSQSCLDWSQILLIPLS